MQKNKKSNGWLFLDKPVGLSSNKILQTVRKIFENQKAGYVGTLDPLASGFLPIALGKATRVIYYLENSQKEYEFDVLWGKQTSTGDSEGKIVKESSIIPSKNKILNAVESIKKIKKQRPPRFSAIKIDGERAYNLARKGIDFKISDRPIDILDLRLLKLHNSHLAEFYVRCSSGTYVRSLAESIAEKCHSLCHVVRLRRIGFGKLDKKLISLDSLLSLMHIDNLKEELKPIDYIFDKEIKIEIDYNDVKLLLNGVKISIKKSLLDNINAKESKTNKVFIASYKKDFLAIGKIVENDFYPKEVFDLSE